MKRPIIALASIFLAVALTACSDSDTGEFAGTWKVADTGGKPFQITLSADGKAKADREGEGMEGSWKKDGHTAVISWNTGWTTKIMKDGDKYTKVAYEKGGSNDAPKNSTPAEKVK